MSIEKNTISGAPAAPEHNSLWHEAYEYPLVTAGAVAATAAAAYFGGSAAVRLWMNRPCDVLLFERTKFMGKALKDVLQEDGHRVTWLAGMKSLDHFIGEDAAGSAVALDPKKFDFAVVAGGLDGKYSGMDIVGNLTSKRIPSLGLGTSIAMTDALRTNGAMASNKAVAFQSLVDKSFSLRGAMRTPDLFQARLDELTTRIQQDPTVTKPANERLMKAMKEVTE